MKKLREFLEFIENTTKVFAIEAKSQLVKELYKKVVEVKLSKEMEVEYMTLLQRNREKIEEGIEQGIDRTIKIIKLLHSGLEVGEIAKKLSIKEEEVRLVLKEMEEDNLL